MRELILNNYQLIQLVASIIIPVFMVIGSYIALKIDVTRNQERISGLKEDITEIKTDVKDVKQHLIL